MRKGIGTSSICSLFPPDGAQMNRRSFRLTATWRLPKEAACPARTEVSVCLPDAELRMSSDREG